MGVLSGEYWICPDGDILYADGDTGDKNHSYHALEEATRQLFEAVEQCDDDGLRAMFARSRGPDYYEADAVMLREDLNNAQDAYLRQKNADPRLEDYDQCLQDIGVHEELLACLFTSNACPRDWARKHCGWISVVGVNGRIALYDLTDAKAKYLRDGLWDIAEEQGVVIPDDHQFDVWDEKTQSRYPVSWQTMQDGLAVFYSPLVRRIDDAVGV